LSFVFTNQHAYPEAAEYFSLMEHIDRVDWPLLQSRDFRHDPEDPGKKERYQAEALVYRHLPAKGLLGIACASDAARQWLQNEVNSRNMQLPVVLRPGWYF
jgi:hypothetical protein